MRREFGAWMIVCGLALAGSEARGQTSEKQQSRGRFRW